MDIPVTYTGKWGVGVPVMEDGRFISGGVDLPLKLGERVIMNHPFFYYLTKLTYPVRQSFIRRKELIIGLWFRPNPMTKCPSQRL